MQQEWVPAHSGSLPNEIEMGGSRTKTVATQPFPLKGEEHSKELCNVNVGFLLPRPCLEPNISKSVAREDVPHFLKGQQRKFEGELIYSLWRGGAGGRGGAVPEAHGSSQARGQIRVAASGLYHSHSNTGSEPHLQPTPQLMATPDP